MMNARNFVCFALGIAAGLGIVMLFRSQNTFVDPPEWVYGIAILAGAAVAIGSRLLLVRLWKNKP